MVKKLCCSSSGADSRCSDKKFEITSGSIVEKGGEEGVGERFVGIYWSALVRLRTFTASESNEGTYILSLELLAES